MTEIIITADDFGISKGVNEAVISMHKNGNLTNASLMITAKYFRDAIQKAKKSPDLKLGLHFNLTTGKAVLNHISIPLLTDENSNFKNGFVKLLLLSIFKRKSFLSQVEAELKAQIDFAKSSEIKLNHIDGHRHVHFLPGVFNVVMKVAKQNSIQNIRVINESLIHTLKLGKIPPISGLVKWFILRLLGLFNGSSKHKAPYFFSIIHSCQISNELTQKFKPKPEFEKVEFMLHPSFSSLDKTEEIEYEKQHLFSHFREIETKFIKPKL